MEETEGNSDLVVGISCWTGGEGEPHCFLLKVFFHWPLFTENGWPLVWQGTPLNKYQGRVGHQDGLACKPSLLPKMKC